MRIKFSKFIIPAFYAIGMAAFILISWQEQKGLLGIGDVATPLYRNINENVWIRRGFDPEWTRQFPSAEEWRRYETDNISISNAPLDDLPKRFILSPRKLPDEEFTLNIPLEIDTDAIAYLNSNPLARPGLFFGLIGMNWEIFINGTLVDSRIFLDKEGQIKKQKLGANLSIPLDKTLITGGTSILSARIIGDPDYIGTGFFLSTNYLDDYSLIEARKHTVMWTFISAFFIFSGVYFLFLFFSIRNKREVYYLYFSLLSLLSGLYTAFLNGVIKIDLPSFDFNSSIPFLLGLSFLSNCAHDWFVESIGRGRITLVVKINTALAFIFLIAMGLSSSLQFVQILTAIYGGIISILCSTFVIVYDIIYFYFWDKNGPRKTGRPLDSSVVNVFIAVVLMYVCANLQLVINIIFFPFNFNTGYFMSVLAQIGIFFVLAQRFSGMYKRLEQSNVILEATVIERTQELEKQTAIAVKENRAKSEFLATMSHELRTPLNAVIGFSEIEMRNKSGESSRDNIRQIYHSGSYLLGIINDILDIPKIESGNLAIIPAEYDTAVMISDIVNLNMVRIGVKPITFALEIGADFPRTLTGDELRVRQILNNLLSNAVKYTEKGTITVTVSRDHDLVSFMVRDTGIGIRPDDMEKLFHSYTQLDAGMNRKAGGTGLGLVIAKKLARMMGGDIEVTSEYGKGSCFTVRIAQAAADSAGIGEETASALRNFQYMLDQERDGLEYLYRYRWLGDKKALIVDDVPANLDLMTKLLAPYCLQTETASSGRQAIEKIQSGLSFDLIFMDHMMPDMDGVETAAAIREYEKDRQDKNPPARIPIIALTANTMHGMKEYYLEQGFDDYLSKPVNTKVLDEMLFNFQGNREPPSSPVQMEIYSRRVDMLNHYRVSFENAPADRKIETGYFERFAALVETWAAHENSEVRENAASLAKAGRSKDYTTILQRLGVFCDMIKEQKSEEKDDYSGILLRLKENLLAGKTEEAEKVLSEMGAASLNPEGRSLYLRLYESILTGEREKALEMLKEKGIA